MAKLFEFYALLLNIFSYTLLALACALLLLFALDSLDWAEMILQWRDNRIRPGVRATESFLSRRPVDFARFGLP